MILHVNVISQALETRRRRDVISVCSSDELLVERWWWREREDEKEWNDERVERVVDGVEVK